MATKLSAPESANTNISAPTVLQEQSPFFRTPFEVRERIYDYYLVFSICDFQEIDWLDGVKLERQPRALALTCRQAYHELQPQMKREAALLMYHRSCDCDEDKTVLNVLSSQGFRVRFGAHCSVSWTDIQTLHVIPYLHHPMWDLFIVHVSRFIRKLPNLKRLVFDWYCSSDVMMRLPDDEDLGWIAGIFVNDILSGVSSIESFGGWPKFWTELEEKHCFPRVKTSYRLWDFEHDELRGVVGEHTCLPDFDLESYVASDPELESEQEWESDSDD